MVLMKTALVVVGYFAIMKHCHVGAIWKFLIIGLKIVRLRSRWQPSMLTHGYKRGGDKDLLGRKSKTGTGRCMITIFVKSFFNCEASEQFDIQEQGFPVGTVVYGLQWYPLL